MLGKSAEVHLLSDFR